MPDVMPEPGPASGDGNGVPSPVTGGLGGRARVIANRAFAETIPLQPNGHGPDRGNGHGPDGLAAGEPARPPRALP